MIVITGATGHIGNVLVRQLLSRGANIRVMVPPGEDAVSLDMLEAEKVEGDVLNLDSLVRAFTGADVVYHLAGIVTIMPGQKELLYRVNVIGTQNVVKACLRCGVGRLVYTSSVHAIETPSHGTVIDETFPYAPGKVLGDYAKSKSLATLGVLKGVGQGLNAVIVCPSGVIGPYDYKISEMGQLIINSVKGKIKTYVEGAYDFVDVRDAATGIMLVCEKGRKGESYIVSGEQVTLRNLMVMIEDITGVRTPFLKIPSWLARTVGKAAPLYCRLSKSKPLFTDYSIDVLVSNSLISHKKAYSELGYSPRPVRESVADTIQWFRENGKLENNKRGPFLGL
jgi:dihydroflavonol-4-reductase